MKQTAVEWFAERIQSDKIFNFETVLSKAKEMEKQQQVYSEEDMEKAFQKGLNRSFDSDFDRWFEHYKKK